MLATTTITMEVILVSNCGSIHRLYARKCVPFITAEIRRNLINFETYTLEDMHRHRMLPQLLTKMTSIVIVVVADITTVVCYSSNRY